MTQRPLVIALEGPCGAGKTTLSHTLGAELVGWSVGYVRCYSDHVGGGRFLPRPVPTSLVEDQHSLESLLGIECERVASVLGTTKDVLVIDRSVHTLLAHRYALDRLLNLGLFRQASGALLRSTAPAWPGVVLYLDISQEVILTRGESKFSSDSIYMNAGFNAGIRSYFQRLAKETNPRTVWLDASLGKAELATLAKEHLLKLSCV